MMDRSLNGAVACILCFNAGMFCHNGQYLFVLFFLAIAAINFYRAFQCEKEKDF